MKLKLQKDFRHTYRFAPHDYFESYTLHVKVKKENPEWTPWESVCPCSLHIIYDSNENKYGHHWRVSSWSDRMDKQMNELLGSDFKSYPSRKEMLRDLQKIVLANRPVHYVMGKEIVYELD